MPASRKLYIDLAEALAASRRLDAEQDHARYCVAVADALIADNARFDPDRFLAAAGCEAEDYEVLGGFFGPRYIVATNRVDA